MRIEEHCLSQSGHAVARHFGVLCSPFLRKTHGQRFPVMGRQDAHWGSRRFTKALIWTAKALIEGAHQKMDERLRSDSTKQGRRSWGSKALMQIFILRSVYVVAVSFCSGNLTTGPRGNNPTSAFRFVFSAVVFSCFGLDRPP